MKEFNGLGMNLGNLSRLSKARTRSISAENPRGEKGKGGMATEGTGAGCARDLGQGWKVSPSVRIEAGETYTIADIGLPDWGCQHTTSPGYDNRAWVSDPYRRCCTANSWSGFVLAAHIMGLKDSWNHDALFDYQDRYMSIETYGEWTRDWSSGFVEDMWDTYRADYGSVWKRYDPDRTR